MDEFKKAYKKLNDQQKNAVNEIQGPVLVIAGPGTGKTELLALRAANILRRDSTILPSNILCMTFTDKAAENLRERLIRYIGQDAYRIGVYTFHSFGAHVMSLYPEYFFAWRETKTADSLATHRLLEKVLSGLPGDSDLAGRSQEGLFYSMRQIKNFIFDAKNNNLSPNDLRKILSDNERACQKILPTIRELWPPTMKKNALDSINELVDWAVLQSSDEQTVETISPLKNMMLDSLMAAAAESQASGEKANTKPFTAWKDQWLVKGEDGEWLFATQKQSARLLQVCDVYEQYQEKLNSGGLADFSDQISWTINALDKNPELRLNLQERYQYIMLDEFQDTNRPQLQLARYLTEPNVRDYNPNILAVGDDDQAIFRFQGADLGNIEEFEAAYPGYKTINLKENYRSNPIILNSAAKINRQIKLSLARQKGIDKTPIPRVSKKGLGAILNEFEHEAEHYSWIARQIKTELKTTAGREIAVLARERAQLDSLIPYLRHLQVPVNYERRENVLDQEHIVCLLNIARLVNNLAEQRLSQANELIPQILSDPMWGIEPKKLWQISVDAYKSGNLWLDVIYALGDSQLIEIADFFIGLGAASQTQPLEQVLDTMIGTEPSANKAETWDAKPPRPKLKAGFISPFKEYFFSEQLRNEQPSEYLTFLSHLNTLRRHLREYQSGEQRTLKLSDLLDFCDSYARAELRMVDKAPHREDANAVQLLTIHGAKGLEFETVFAIGLQHSIWTKSGGSNRFSYPANLQEIKNSDNQEDDGLRLLFVALTRAKQNLYLNYFKQGEDQKTHQLYAPLLSIGAEPKQPAVLTDGQALTEQYEQRWLIRHKSIDKADMKSLLQHHLDNYQLSATHLNNFTNVTAGGPLYFLTQNLLNFPSGMHPKSVFGTVIHSALADAHRTIIRGKKVNIAKIIASFKTEISTQALSEEDKARFIKEGELALKAFLDQKLDGFKDDQKVEFDFQNQGVTIGAARLRGFADLIDADSKTKKIQVTDYKTGAALKSWSLPPSAQEYERIKAHQYRNQLLFYKLLVDGSNDFGLKGYIASRGELSFVEPDAYGKIRTLGVEYEPGEVERLKKLITAVWQKIQNLDFDDDMSKYPQSADGITQFEDDLING